jgi:hypothetical protein
MSSATPPANSGNTPVPYVNITNYPGRPTAQLIKAMANEVLQGASIQKAAMAFGVTPGKIRHWMHWGRAAAERDAGPEDPNAAYIEVYIMLMQAQARSQLIAEQILFATDPAAWLSRHPEAREEWAQMPVPSILTEDIQDTTVDANVVDVQAPRATPTDLRATLRTLYEVGAARALPAPQQEAKTAQDDHDAPDDHGEQASA